MTPDARALATAIQFHETYERLAPSFGYETRTETRAFDPTIPNGRLMIAVCGELLAALPAPSDATVERMRKALERFVRATAWMPETWGKNEWVACDGGGTNLEGTDRAVNALDIREARLALQAAGGGEGGGWVRVPREPTEAMIAACYTPPNNDGDRFRKAGTFTPAEAYCAMIAAAPVSDGSSQEGGT